MIHLSLSHLWNTPPRPMVLSCASHRWYTPGEHVKKEKTSIPYMSPASETVRVSKEIHKHQLCEAYKPYAFPKKSTNTSYVKHIGQTTCSGMYINSTHVYSFKATHDYIARMNAITVIN
ncbi:hypothetical protein AVEN_221270-1 [Araneus ventricosus]|uniref:Uncharacterized protein n=1 Tax=Araneus ventricosus TaxID=182803 RepID=A0A4Y2B0R4_ARAVE|nr:hypothetical protein AVEN_221270-1 [Araneus ventricosus]